MANSIANAAVFWDRDICMPILDEIPGGRSPHSLPAKKAMQAFFDESDEVYLAAVSRQSSTTENCHKIREIAPRKSTSAGLTIYTATTLARWCGPQLDRQ
ncbi:MAG: hypothetical protein K8T91_00495 [Planctomycetes bacterium]|nr:hypothetical protein [Planctomycetota bacterium]